MPLPGVTGPWRLPKSTPPDAANSLPGRNFSQTPDIPDSPLTIQDSSSLSGSQSFNYAHRPDLALACAICGR